MLLLGVVGLLVVSSPTEAAPQRTGIVRGVVRTEGAEGSVRLQIRAIGYATQTVIVSVSITLPYFVSRKVRLHTWDTRFFESCCERRGGFTYSGRSNGGGA